MPSVGSVGGSYENTLTETINGLFEAEVIRRQRSRPSLAAVEMATLRWVERGAWTRAAAVCRKPTRKRESTPGRKVQFLKSAFRP